MGTQAQQALERRRPAGSGGADQRNAAGTRKAQALARDNSGTRSKRIADAPKETFVQDQPNWVSGQPENITGTGGGRLPGYGGKAVTKASERANPGRLIRDTIGAMASPTNVRAVGSIWDDPNYAAMANEHGAEYAMRARNLDRQINSARDYRQMVDEGREARYAEESRRRQDSMEQAGYQATMGAQGTPQQIEEAFGPGARREEDGTIVGPSGGAYDAKDASGAYTGGQTGPAEEKLLPSQVPATGKEATEAETQTKMQTESIQSIGKLIEGLSKIDQYNLPDDQKKSLNEQLKTLNQQYQQLTGAGAQGSEDPNHISQPQTADELRSRLVGAQPDDMKDENGELKPEHQEKFNEVYNKYLKKFGLSE